MANSVNPDQTAPIGLVSNVRQLFAADNFSRRHFSDAFFLRALRVKSKSTIFQSCQDLFLYSWVEAVLSRG